MAVFTSVIIEAKSVCWESSVPFLNELSASVELASRPETNARPLSINHSNHRAFDDSTAICPDDITTYTDLNSCVAVISTGLNINDPNNIISSLTWEMTGANEASSNSSGINQLNSYSFNEGTTVITYRGATLYNNSIYCTFTVTVSDNQVPRLENPQEDITVTADAGDCYAFVNWAEPVVSDNCASPGQILITASHEPGNSFPVGTTEVSYSINDGIEYNNLEHSFTVTVVDEELPELFAPHAITLDCGDAIPDAFTNWQQFYDAGGMAVDNCNIDFGSFKYEGQESSGIRCPYTITRTYSIADGEGNVAEVEHLIYVGEGEEEEAPVVLKSGMADYTTVKSGNWNDPTVWSSGVVPTAADNVTILNTHVVTVDAAAVCDNITIDAGGELNHGGSLATTLQVNGNWTNNGTYDGGTNGIVAFVGAGNATISGTTNFEGLEINKSDGLSSILTISGDVSVLSSGSLTMASGLVAIPGSGSLAINPSSNLDIEEPAGFDVLGGDLTTGNFTITNEGLIRIASGSSVSFGTNSGNEVHTQYDGAFIVTGGTVDIAGRLYNSASGTLDSGGLNITSGITISGGTVTLCTVGNGASSTGSLQVTSAGNFDFSGGTIVFQRPSTAATELDLGLLSGTGTKNTTGGTFQFGNTSTPASSSFNISSEIPVDRITSSANADLVLEGDLIVNDLSLNNATSIDLNGNSLIQVISGTGTYSFPLDDGSGNDVSVDITINSVSSYGAGPYIEITTTNEKHGDNASSTNYLSRYWTITFNDINGPNYSLSANYPSVDVAGTESEIAAAVWTGSTPWIKGNTASGNTISATGLTDGGTIILSGITLDAPTVEINGGATNVEFCDGASTVLTAVPTGDPGWNYSWSPATGLSATDVASPTASPSANTTYTVTVTDGNGFTASDDIDVVVNPLPTVSAPTDVCVGETETLSPTTGGTWTSNNPSVATVDASGTITGVSVGTVTFTFTESSTGCSNTTSSVTVNSLPNAPTKSNVTECYDGTTYTGSVTAGVGESVVWYNADTGGSEISAPSGSAVGVYVAYAASRNNTTGCESASRTLVTVTINALPTATAESNSPVCENETINLTASGGTSYSWSGPDGFTSTQQNPSISNAGLVNAGAYTVTVTDGNGCSNSETVDVTVNPLTGTPVFTAGAATVCQDAADETYTANAANSTSISYSVSPAGAGTINSSTGLMNWDASFSGMATITATATGLCGTTTEDLIVTVNPSTGTPLFTSGAITVCQDAADETYTATAANSTSISYSVSPAGAGTINSSTGLMNWDASFSGTATITATATGLCGTTTEDLTIVVYPLPTATISGTTTICESDATTITIDLTGTQPWSVTYTDGTTPVTQNNITSNPYTFNVSPAGNTTYTLTDVSDANCAGTVSGSAAITIRPTPTVTISGDDEVCQNTSPDPEITVFNPMALGVIVYFNINGGATQTRSLNAGETITIQQATTSANVFNYNFESVTYQAAPTCSNPIGTTTTITVHPTPTVDAIANQTYCNGDYISGIALTGSPVGTTFEWTNDNTAIGLGSSGTGNIPEFDATNTTTDPISATVTVTPTANGCTGPEETFTITVRPTLSASISGSDTVCLNDPTPYIIFTNPIGSPVTITYNRNSALQPVINVPANSTAQVAVPTGTAGTFIYDPVKVAYQNAPECDESMSGTATVVVNPAPIAGATPQTQDICSDETITSIELTSSITGVTFNWTRDHAEITGIETSGQGDISGSLTNNTGSTVTVTFTITPEYDGCPGTSTTAKVIVYPTPVVILSPYTQIRCSGEAISSIVPSSTSGGSFTWTRDHVADVTGIAASGTGAVPTSTVTNTTSEPITVSFIFIPTANGCVGIPDTATVLVNPTPYIIDTSEIICNAGTFDFSPVDSVHGIVPDGTTYKWTVNSTTGGISGASDSDVDGVTSISGTLSNSSNSTQYVTYAVTPYYGSCPRGELFYLTVYVTPEPDIDDLNTEVCSGEPFTVTPQNNTNGIVPPGTTYDWVVTSVPPEVTGANGGSGTGITDTLLNSSNTNQLVTYTVTPTAGSCEGVAFTVDVTVKPAPAINNLTAEACSEESFTVTPVDGSVNDGVVPAGTTYSWPIPTTSGSLTGGSPGSGASTISGTLTNTSDTPQTATYMVTPSVGGCAGTPFEVVVTVYPVPEINPMSDTICSGEDFNLIPLAGINGSIPTGTITYSWPAPSVTGGITGGVSGSGSSINGTLINTTNSVQTATYTVTPTSGACDGIVFTVIVRVDPAPSINDMNTTVCSGVPFSITPLNGTDGFVPSGTIYSWNAPTVPADITGEAGGSGSADISGILTNSSNTAITVTYTVEAISAGCSPDTFDVNVTVNPPISAAISGSDTVCDNAGSTLVTFSNPTDQPVTVTYNINGGFNYTLDIAANDVSTVTANISAQGTFHYVLTGVRYQFDPLCQTVLDDTATIVVQPITTASISASATTICYSTPVTFTAVVANYGTNPAYQWKINGVDTLGENSLTFTSSTLENGDVITFEVETFDTPCPSTTTSNPVTMTVNDLNIPDVTIYESANPVCDGASVTFTADPVVNGGTTPDFEWIVNGSTVSTGSNSTYSYEPSNGDDVKVVLTSSASCPGPPDTSNVIVMTVDPILPVSVILTVDSDTVCEGATVTFTAIPENGGLNPLYEWTVDGSTVNISSDSTYTYTPQDGDVVNVELTSSETCASGNPAIATPISITVETPPTATASGSATTCINSAYTLGAGEASASNGTIFWTHDGAGTITAGETTLTPTYTPLQVMKEI
ncbi:PKD-like domain-containing protein [Draconibacterium halophilum]|uniref:HYR domain-containing protein n=1 Tax=Draconibacterium halophilum TaxID=2706887 RepID=A0A6C0R7L7_9BACT|nr:PKD-like domain-containing protein [Draconibacterium halophilum]QIA06264.1 HYR domain-containing protein [Draconibacterium halophilum]